ATEGSYPALRLHRLSHRLARGIAQTASSEVLGLSRAQGSRSPFVACSRALGHLPNSPKYGDRSLRLDGAGRVRSSDRPDRSLADESCAGQLGLPIPGQVRLQRIREVSLRRLLHRFENQGERTRALRLPPVAACP